MWGWRSSRTVVIALAGAVFAVGCVLPVATLLVTSLGGATETLLLDARQWGLLGNTARFGVGTALVATAIGTPLGLVLARAPLPHRAWLRVALAAPVLLPPYVVALAWTYLGGSRGLVATLTGYDRLAAWIDSVPGAVLVMSLVVYPIVMLATEAAVRRVDGRLEEAALLVASPRRVFWRITVPLAAPSIVAAALVVFVLAASEFGVPGVLRVRVYTTEIFTAFAALYDPGRAALLAWPLLMLCLAVAAVAVAVAGGAPLASARRGARTPGALHLERSGAVVAGLVVALAAALVLPLGLLAREASGNPSVLAVVGGSGEAIANSLWLAAIGATIVVGVALPLGYTRARTRVQVGRLADVVLVGLFAVPGTLVGVGLITLWNRPGPLGAVYGTDSMLVLACLARLLPVAVLALAASARAVPVTHEDAAEVAGAGWLRTMACIVVPQMRLGVAAAWLVVFVLAFGELGVSIVVAPPGETTLPIRIYTIIANTPSSSVATLALLQAGVVLAPLVALAVLLYDPGGVVSTPAVSLSRVSKRLGAHPALTDVSLDVPPGGAAVVLGPSGSGKTTLLRLVAGLETPDTGTVSLDGALVAQPGRTLVPPYRRGIGFVFQDLALWPHLTVADNLAFVLGSLQVPRRQRGSRTQQALDLVRIGPLGGRYPHQLSGGEQQRVALARALVGNPRVLLLDEPLSSLDPELRVTLRAELHRVRRELHVAMLYVTHDREDAAVLADEVVEMRAGRVTAVTGGSR